MPEAGGAFQLYSYCRSSSTMEPARNLETNVFPTSTTLFFYIVKLVRYNIVTFFDYPNIENLLILDQIYYGTGN